MNVQKGLQCKFQKSFHRWSARTTIYGAFIFEMEKRIAISSEFDVIATN